MAQAVRKLIFGRKQKVSGQFIKKIDEFFILTR